MAGSASIPPSFTLRPVSGVSVGEILIDGKKKVPLGGEIMWEDIGKLLFYCLRPFFMVFIIALNAEHYPPATNLSWVSEPL